MSRLHNSKNAYLKHLKQKNNVPKYCSSNKLIIFIEGWLINSNNREDSLQIDYFIHITGL